MKKSHISGGKDTGKWKTRERERERERERDPIECNTLFQTEIRWNQATRLESNVLETSIHCKSIMILPVWSMYEPYCPFSKNERRCIHGPRSPVWKSK